MAILWRNFDINDLAYKEAKLKIEGNAKPRFIKITRKNGSPLAIQLPKARSPFGPSRYEETDKYSVNLSLDPADPNMEQLTNILKQLDARNLHEAELHSAEWLNEEMSKDRIESGRMYKSYIRPDKKGKNPPSFKLKLPFFNEKPSFTVEPKNSSTPIDLMTEDNEFDMSWGGRGMEVISIIEVEGLWIIGSDKIYPTCKVARMKIISNSNRLTNYQFNLDGEEGVNEADNKCEPSINEGMEQIDLSETYTGESDDED